MVECIAIQIKEHYNTLDRPTVVNRDQLEEHLQWYASQVLQTTIPMPIFWPSSANAVQVAG